MRSRFIALLFLATLVHSQESKDRLVRDTEALTPAAEQAALHVPPGFRVQLFASEPMINKPINIAFDARGRLWVSSTVEYPFAAKQERWADAQGTRVKDSRDAIKILEDTDGDGAADKVTDFADGLNIPTGVQPWHKPEHKDGCIAWSIPNIWYFADTDGDGKADLREVLFGPLGYEKDTHGMCSSFRLGLDGWVYATHGFSNTSHFKVLPQHQQKTADGKPKTESDLVLQSGNVFRFRPDGSRVELWSSGQVNPFGLCWDRYNNLYSADCHSNPISQLIHGACYASFGKPHDGLGFAPVMCEHAHGSTGLCGIIYIDGGVWGPEWDDHMFVGNCVTSKVNHDKITFTGSTPKANEAPDFITSDDPWFRPVDLQLGPDSALYVADFYNKVIGHYEVPLDHLGRDKERGRIWRVVKEAVSESLRPLDFSDNLTERAIDIIAKGPMARSRLAVQKLQTLTKPGFISRPMVPQTAAIFQWGDQHRERLLAELPVIIGATRPQDEQAKVMCLQQAAAFGVTTAAWRAWALPMLKDSSPQVRCAAVAAFQAHPGQDSMKPLLECWDRTPDDDMRLKHQLRLTLREHLKEVFNLLAAVKTHRSLAIEIAQAVPTTDAASFLFSEWKRDALGHADAALLIFITRNGSPSLIEQLIKAAHEHQPADTESIAAIHNGLLERGAKPPPALIAWATELAETMLALSNDKAEAEWESLPHAASKVVSTSVELSRGQTTPQSATNSPAAPAKKAPSPLPSPSPDATKVAATPTQTSASPLPNTPPDATKVAATSRAFESPWCLQQRKDSDGKAISVLSSLNQALKAPEKLTGILRSKTFTAPAKLTFDLCGHQGFPTTAANKKNLARLVDEQGNVLHEAYPPRSDIAQRMEWDLAAIKGKPVRFELADGDDGTAYAWLAAGSFEPAVISSETFSSADSRQKQLKTLALILRTTAPVGLRDRLAAYLPVPPQIAKAKPQPEIDALIKQRVAAFAKAKPDAKKGEQVFATQCAVCHTIGGKGGLIGPQLDGIGKRGVDRIAEDILDPHRNVDAHFNLHTMKQRDGSTLTGFVRGEVGQTWIIADAVGNEQRLAKGDVVEDTELPQSLMPPTFGQTIEPTSFSDLLGFLLSQ